MTRPFLLKVCAALWAGLAAAPAAQAGPRHVLLLYSYEREFSHYTFAGLFRPELTRTSPEPIDFIELSGQSIRASGNERELQTLADVRGALGNEAIDLVVPIGGPAAAFAQRHRADLFPDTPV